MTNTDELAVNAVTIIVVVAAFGWVIKRVLDSDWIWWD